MSYVYSTKQKNGKLSSVLLCSKYREGKKVKTRTVANLSASEKGAVNK